MKILLIFILLSASQLIAQRYNISGTVTDSTGAGLSGVNIFITETDYGTATNSNGFYELKDLRPGRYTLQYSMIGYKKTVMTNIALISKSVVLDVILEPQILESKEVLITAGKHQQTLEDLTESAEIISAEIFTRRNSVTLEDVMRYVPGVIMTEDQISIRGSTGYGRGAGTRVLLAIDGIPMFTGDTGEIIWGILPLSEIERVEVIKGAASSLYGTSAIGGVINVITKRVETVPRTHFKAYYGVYDKPSYDQWDWSGEYREFNGISLSHSNMIGGLGFTAALNRQQDRGFRQNGFFTRYTGYLKTLYNITPSSSISLFFNSLNQHGGNFIYWKDAPNALVPPDEDVGQTVRSDRYMIGLLYKHLFSSIFYMNVRSGYYRTKWEDESTSRNSSLSGLFRTEVQTNLSLSSNTLLVTGVENTLGSTDANIFGERESVGAGIYLQLEHKFSFPLSLTAGARYDYSKIDSIDGSSAFSPKIGLNYKLTDQFILRASAGKGFRAPSLAEVFTSTTTSGITVRPNPELKSETSFSFEAGVLYKLSEWIFIDAAAFQNEFYDFIEPELRVDNAGNSYGIFDNITRARIQGFELNNDYYLINSSLHFSFSYTYLWARDLNTGKALKYRPRHLGQVTADYKMFNFETGVAFRYASKVEEVDSELIRYVPIPDGEKRVDVYVLDFSIGYNLISHGIPGRLFFNAKNLLNYNYVELIGNLAPIRSFSLNAELFF